MPESGSKIGSYEIVRELGRGGMGVVYLARDAKLDRDVAIKVLPAELAEDKERVARFEREAKTLASLNHPNIGAIYGFEEAGDKRFLVLEYVAGETLSQRIKNGPLQIDDALEIGKQIADALEAAHEKGVIHRDLKPANVQIRRDGTVKVLDFGLAKAMAPTDESSQAQIENSPTITADFTLPGTILGTAAYMSPEQARGKHLDKRSDIWSFGCVLFECLGGRKPFEGETATDLIARILEREPNWENLPPETPPFVKTVLRRCLQKARKDRLRDAGDVGLMLAGPAQEDGREDLSGEAARTGNRRLAIVGVISAILAASLTGFGVWSATRPEPPRVARLAIPQPPDRTWFHRQSAATFAISRDGRSVAYCSIMRMCCLSRNWTFPDPG